MTSSTTAPRLPFWLFPFERIGRTVFATLAYFGGVASLLVSAGLSLFGLARDEDQPGFWFTFRRELSWLLMMGLPLVGLVHIGMGSFLSLQAYFGSTFVDGTGAVVGVGLLRNLATLMTGLTVSAMLAGRSLARPVPRSESGTEAAAPTGQLAAPRLAAAALGTMLLSLWGFLVGTLVGWQCADTMMGLSSETFFLMFYRMIWFRDVIGVIVKGVLFGLLPAAICCYEGMRGEDQDHAHPTVGEPTGSGAQTWPADMSTRLLRATCLSMVSILVMNMTWFLLVYHAVPVYGPSLLNPPTP
jgi:phospholipid/cholesterol/gamma-HCH transport system permease protein